MKIKRYELISLSRQIQNYVHWKLDGMRWSTSLIMPMYKHFRSVENDLDQVRYLIHPGRI